VISALRIDPWTDYEPTFHNPVREELPTIQPELGLIDADRVHWLFSLNDTHGNRFVAVGE
jgi:hypothetical protein